MSGRERAEFFGRNADEDGEQDQEEELGDLEGCFGAGGGERVEGGNLHEELRDEDEDVEVLRDHGCDGVGAAPASVEVPGIEGEERDDFDTRAN